MAGCPGIFMPGVPPFPPPKVTILDDFPRFQVWLKAQPEFETKKRFLILSDIIHKPSGEKVKEGFRYLDVDGDTLLAAFDSGDFEAIAALPRLFDEEGEPDTGAVSVWLGYTKGGAFLAIQPQVDVNYVPTYPREPKYFTPKGDLFTAARELDQSF